MVQGLSMAQDFLGKLVGEIERQGGYAAQLHFLTTSRGEETLREVAKVIANAKWQVPLSLIRRLVGEASKEDWQETYVESDMAWGWQLTVLAKLGIPFIFWHKEEGPFDGLSTIKHQIRGRKFTRPIIVRLDGKDYIFTNFDSAATAGQSSPGEVTFLEKIERIDFFTLVEVSHIDLTR